MKSHQIQIREGNVQEVVALTQKFPEFESPYSSEEYLKRLHNVPFLILIAEVGGKMAGCKLGYERNKDGSFYSWIGGVLPAFRRMGIARMLAEEQESWVRENGYHKIRFKTRNVHRNMLLFAIQRGFLITGFEPYPNLENSRIWLEKGL